MQSSDAMRRENADSHPRRCLKFEAEPALASSQAWPGTHNHRGLYCAPLQPLARVATTAWGHGAPLSRGRRRY